MTKQAVFIQNKVNSSEIRKIKNEFGDEVLVIPSYTLPSGCVMNGLLYPEDEIASSYQTLENTLAPVGHPVTPDGEYISATDAMAIDYFHAGIVNKNVQRVVDPKYGHRIYLEKHINVKVAQQTERGRAVLDAVAKRQPIHSSTGLLLEIEYTSGVKNGKEYYGIARNITADHDAVLLYEDGAATPEDGVGLFVSKNLIKQVNRNGQQLQVNTALSPNMERTMLDKLKAHMDAFFNSLAVHGEAEKPTGADSVNTNQEGNSMDLKKSMIDELGDAYNEDMSDADILKAYKAKIKGNAAEQPAAKGEQSQPGELEVNADIEKLIEEKVQAVLAANALKAEKAERDSLTAEITANSKDFTVEDLAAVPVATLRKMAANSKVKKHSFGVAGGQVNSDQGAKVAFDDLPE